MKRPRTGSVPALLTMAALAVARAGPAAAGVAASLASKPTVLFALADQCHSVWGA